MDFVRMRTYAGETLYDPSTRLESGLPAIIAEEGALITETIRDQLLEAGIESFKSVTKFEHCSTETR